MKNSTTQAIEYILESNLSKITPSVNITDQDVMQIIEASNGLKYVLTLNELELTNSSNFREKLLFSLKASQSMCEFINIREKLVSSFFMDFVKFGDSEIKEILVSSAPLCGYAKQINFDIVEAILLDLRIKLEAKQKQVIKHISIDTSSDKVSYVKMNIDENLVDNINNIKGVKIVNFKTGSGKTKHYTKPAFNKACEDGLTPIGISPKRILAAMICNDDRNYKNVGAEIVPGVFGVINSIASNERFKAYTNKSALLICEEHEEIKSQCVGRAVKSGKLLERAELLSAYYDIIKNTEDVVLIDAMFSTSEIERIIEITGRSVTVISEDTEEVKRDITINILKESENVARAARRFESGKNVLAFSDGSNKGEKSKFNEIYHAVTQGNKSALAITANTISEQEDEMAFICNIENKLSQYRYAQISPVINSGVSLESGHFNSNHLFLNQVIPLKAAIQTMSRDRLAKEINVSINTNMSPKVTSIDAIIANEMFKDVTGAELSDDLYNAYKSNKAVNTVAEIISEENKVKVDYEISLIIALRYLGFNVNFDADNEEKGIEDKKIGREIEESLRIESFIKADKEPITIARARALTKKDFITNDDKIKLAVFDMKEFYNTDTIDAELIKFDDKGDKRRIIENNLIASRSMPKMTNDLIKKHVIDFLLSTLNIDAINFSGTYNKNDAELFINKIKGGSFTITSANNETFNVSCSQAFLETFNMRLPKGHASTIVSKLLSSKFGIKTEYSGQETIEINGKKPRVNTYNLSSEKMDQMLLETIVRLRSGKKLIKK